ncbi:MAG: nitroreductase family protein, partial [Methylotenera sp.]|nr:nitroreductase family protein [Methylotenera sp.]
MHKPAITQVPINATIAARWSGRAYAAQQDVSPVQLTALLEAARWAPSCFGDQPWRFIIWHKSSDKQAWQAAFDCLSAGNQSWVKDAPVLILLCANSVFNHNQQPNRWAQYDCGAAAENLCLQATGMGLSAHQLGGFDVDLAREKFKVPEPFSLMSMISVGYPGDLNALSVEALARQQAGRSRR